MKPRFSSKAILPIIFTAAALIISAAIITAEKSLSPYDYIKKHNKDEAFAPAEKPLSDCGKPAIKRASPALKTFPAKLQKS
jgi:hypothetical protein